ncbi:MAG: flavin reductase family protein, partial [Candidatus Marinimicrobia bacterium]|nr:flavin reductase family protein [Candidatus Neomarinimicrobiota bacterium]
MPFREFDPEDMSLRDRHQLLIGGVGPRPIALVGTLGKDGSANLAPFSFSNAFSSNPPYVGFSPSYRGSDASTKDTLRNVLDTGEFTVSVVSYPMVQQMNLASGEYPPDVDEFEVAGFTKLPGSQVAAPGV